MALHAPNPFVVVWWARTKLSSVVVAKIFIRIRNSSVLSKSNVVPWWSFVRTLLSWRFDMCSVSSQRSRVSLTKYVIGIPALPIRVASSAMIMVLTSCQFVPSNRGTVTANGVA